MISSSRSLVKRKLVHRGRSRAAEGSTSEVPVAVAGPARVVAVPVTAAALRYSPPGRRGARRGRGGGRGCSHGGARGVGRPRRGRGGGGGPWGAGRERCGGGFPRAGGGD